MKSHLFKKISISVSIFVLTSFGVIGVLLGITNAFKSYNSPVILNDLDYQEVSSSELVASGNEGFKFSSSSPRDYDVIIVGAGTSGMAAALQASESPVNILLVEETNWLGGQFTASGVSASDEPWIEDTNPLGRTIDRNSGYYSIFVKKVLEYYGILGGFNSQLNDLVYNLRTEPLVAHGIFREFINQRNASPNRGRITVLYSAKVNSVVKSGDRVTGIKVKTKDQAPGLTLTSKVLIDSSETGYVIPLSGADYRIGNESKSNYSGNSCIQDITYVAAIKYYKDGVPANLKINTAPEKYQEYKSYFNQLVTGESGSIDGLSYPWALSLHNSYRAIPDSTDGSGIISNIQDNTTAFRTNIKQTMINFANDYPAKLPYLKDQLSDNMIYLKDTLSNKYLADQNYKVQVDCEAKLKTINFIYYLQQELDAKWGISDSLGYLEKNTHTTLCSQLPSFRAKFAGLENIEKNMPPLPYVREAIRLVGKETVSAKNVKDNTRYSNSIAYGTYPIDLHNCKVQVQTTEGLYNNFESFESPADIPEFKPKPFEIPMGTLVPNRVKGFLAAEKNISQSRFAAGGTRLQPSTFSIGQAAGALALELINKNYIYENVLARDVQVRLAKTNTILSTNFLTDATLNNTNSSISNIKLESFSAISFVEKTNIMSSSGFGGQFSSNSTVKRADTAVVLHKIIPFTQAEYPASNSSPRIFQDVAPYLGDGSRNWQFGYVEGLGKYLETKGISTFGCNISNGQKFYCPDINIKRIELAAFIYRAQKGNETLPACTGTFGSEVSVELCPFAEYAYTNKFIESCGNQADGKPKFCPSDIINRDLMSKIVVNFLGVNK